MRARCASVRKGAGASSTSFWLRRCSEQSLRAQHDDVAMRVRDDLGFHMARLVEELLDEAFAAAERGHGLAHGRGVQVGHLVHAPRHLDATPATAIGRLDRDRQAVLFRKGQYLVGMVHRPGRAGHQRRTDLQCQLAGLHLVAQRGDGGRRRADPGETGIDHGLGEAGVLGQEAVAGVHGVGTAFPCDSQQLVDRQIGVGRAAAFQAPSLVRHAGVQCVEVGVGIDGDGLHAVVGTGACDPDCDFATVGNQDFVHGSMGAKARMGLKRMRAPMGICPARSRWCGATAAMTG